MYGGPHDGRSRRPQSAHPSSSTQGRQQSLGAAMMSAVSTAPGQPIGSLATTGRTLSSLGVTGGAVVRALRPSSAAGSRALVGQSATSSATAAKLSNLKRMLRENSAEREMAAASHAAGSSSSSAAMIQKADSALARRTMSETPGIGSSAALKPRPSTTSSAEGRRSGIRKTNSIGGDSMDSSSAQTTTEGTEATAEKTKSRLASTETPPPLVLRRTADDRSLNPERLNLDRRRLQRCPLLEGEERLKLLNYQNNQIRRLENLHNLPHLIFLDLYNNHIERIEGLEAVPSLRVLMLGKNNISQIEGLDSLHSLDVLDLHSNEIAEITGLHHLQELRVLNLAGNRIVEVKNLKGLRSLTEINLRRNLVERVFELDELPVLQRVFLSNNHIRHFDDVQCLFGVSEFQELALDGNPVANEELFYRQTLVSRIPALKHLDLKRVTDEERKVANVLAKRSQLTAPSRRSTLDEDTHTTAVHVEPTPHPQKGLAGVSPHPKSTPSQDIGSGIDDSGTGSRSYSRIAEEQSNDNEDEEEDEDMDDEDDDEDDEDDEDDMLLSESAEESADSESPEDSDAEESEESEEETEMESSTSASVSAGKKKKPPAQQPPPATSEKSQSRPDEDAKQEYIQSIRDAWGKLYGSRKDMEEEEESGTGGEGKRTKMRGCLDVVDTQNLIVYGEVAFSALEKISQLRIEKLHFQYCPISHLTELIPLLLRQFPDVSHVRFDTGNIRTLVELYECCKHLFGEHRVPTQPPTSTAKSTSTTSAAKPPSHFATVERNIRSITVNDNPVQTLAPSLWRTFLVAMSTSVLYEVNDLPIEPVERAAALKKYQASLRLMKGTGSNVLAHQFTSAFPSFTGKTDASSPDAFVNQLFTSDAESGSGGARRLSAGYMGNIVAQAKGIDAKIQWLGEHWDEIFRSLLRTSIREHFAGHEATRKKLAELK